MRYVELPNDVGTNATWTWDSSRKCFTASISIISGISPIGFYVEFTNGAAVGQAYRATSRNMIYVFGSIPASMTCIDDGYRFKIYAIVTN